MRIEPQSPPRFLGPRKKFPHILLLASTDRQGNRNVEEEPLSGKHLSNTSAPPKISHLAHFALLTLQHEPLIDAFNF